MVNTTPFHISEFFIKRPVMSMLIMLVLFFYGVAAYRFLPQSDLPATDFPALQVTALWPGANPETMANAVAAPLEKSLAVLNGLKSMHSVNSAGQTQIQLQFELAYQLERATQEVQANVTAAASVLPVGVQLSVIRKIN